MTKPDRVKKLLGKLINLSNEYAEPEYECFAIKDPKCGLICQICGFPFDKKYRQKCVNKVHSQIKSHYKSLVMSEEEIRQILSGTGIIG